METKVFNLNKIVEIQFKTSDIISDSIYSNECQQKEFSNDKFIPQESLPYFILKQYYSKNKIVHKKLGI